jgi:hypothetical protein
MAKSRVFDLVRELCRSGDVDTLLGSCGSGRQRADDPADRGRGGHLDLRRLQGDGSDFVAML